MGKFDGLEFFIPTKLIFGAGTFSKLGEEAKKLGKKALIVTTGLRRTNIIPRSQELLKEAGIPSVVYAGIEPNPKTNNIDEAVELFKKENCDFVIGIGGGSAMDSAKNVAAVAYNGGKMEDYVPVKIKQKPVPDCYPIMCVSTTSGTGSEVTTVGVVTIPSTKQKPALSAPCMFAKVAIVDPELTVGMPKSVTADVGIDTFFHAMEHYLSRSANPMTELYAVQAMEWVVKYLPIACEQPDNMEARSALHLANTLAGEVIQVGTPATLHAISHALSGLTDISHGKTLAMGSYAFMKYTYKGCIERYAKVARILDPELNNVSDEEAAEKSADALRAFQIKLGLPTDIKSLGYNDEQIKDIAESMMIVTPRIVKQVWVPMEVDNIVEMFSLIR